MKHCHLRCEWSTQANTASTFKYRNLVHGKKQTSSIQIQFISLILTFVNHRFLIGWFLQLLSPLLETRFLMSRFKDFQTNDSVGFTHDTQKSTCWRQLNTMIQEGLLSDINFLLAFSNSYHEDLVITKNQDQRDFEIYSPLVNSRIFLLWKVVWRPKHVLLPKGKLLLKPLRRPP